jgi:hypothetical protein
MAIKGGSDDGRDGMVEHPRTKPKQRAIRITKTMRIGLKTIIKPVLIKGGAFPPSMITPPWLDGAEIYV